MSMTCITFWRRLIYIGSPNNSVRYSYGLLLLSWPTILFIMGLFSTSVLIPESSRIGSRCEWWHWGGFCVRRGIFFIRSQTVRQGQEGLAKSAHFKLGVYSRRRARVEHRTCDRYQQDCGSHKEVCPATWRWRTCEKVSTFFSFPVYVIVLYVLQCFGTYGSVGWIRGVDFLKDNIFENWSYYFQLVYSFRLLCGVVDTRNWSFLIILQIARSNYKDADAIYIYIHLEGDAKCPLQVVLGSNFIKSFI